MNSAELPTTTFPSGIEPSAWDEVRRIYRRLCVLRAVGRNDEALALEHDELPPVLAAARVAAHDGFDEAALFSEEAERVANASVLAELVAPLLAAHLRDHASPAPVVPPAVVPALDRAPASHASRPAAAAIPAIADLIDGMLSLEGGSAPRRPR